MIQLHNPAVSLLGSLFLNLVVHFVPNAIHRPVLRTGLLVFCIGQFEIRIRW